MPFKINATGRSILVISDTHIPYSHPDYIKFLKAIKEKYNPEIVIHIGDEVDLHAISFHNNEVELYSAGHELDKAIIELQEGLHRLFPRLYLLESNHGSLVYRKLKANGIPIRVLKPLNELYETPLWSWHHDIIAITNSGPIYFCHGKATTYGKLCKEMGCSAVQGHFHGKFELTYHKTALGTRFNAIIGCLVDEASLAMAYGRNNLPKPILGSLMIDKNGNPVPIRMILNNNNEWVGKL